LEAINIFKNAVNELHGKGSYKTERIITTRQGRLIKTADGREAINFCANNYLGLGGSDFMVEEAKKGLEKYGFGLNSVRFICGTQDIHRELEKKIASFTGTEDAVLYSSAFDANGGLFETLLSDQDVIISDELNHASIIDGIRLCKASRKIFRHNDMNSLEDALKESGSYRIRLIAMDGVFSMDGDIAGLNYVVCLAEKYNALVMIDDSHAVGVIGARGRGTAEAKNVFGKIDIITGTFGKALGGASGGFTACRKEIAELLRNKSRPYLFSNSLAPCIVYSEIKALEKLEHDTGLLGRLNENTGYFRSKITQCGFEVCPGTHPIVPVMIYHEKKALQTANALLEHGIYVIGFCYPVVPQGKARIRVQISAVHTRQDLDDCLQAFKKCVL